MIPGIDVIAGTLAGVMSSGLSAYVDAKKAKAEIEAKKAAYSHEFQMARLTLQTLKIEKEHELEDRRAQNELALAVAESRDFSSRYNEAAKVDNELIKRASKALVNLLSLFRPGLAIYLVHAANVTDAPPHMVTMASWAVAYYFAERARGNTTGSSPDRAFRL